ncbi:hypothetical protein [Streptosporangium sp. NPDC002524]|uniref:hypothetical protein n=1 Tax=Streptosporangium sp. NPDC002524 TaxID=3154537 RepID=UPI00332BFF97
MSEIARRPVELAPLSLELSPQVMAWTGELRAQFTALDMSISLFCRLHPIDKGTVSRYLSGKRVPTDRWFLDQVLALRAGAGTPVTDEVRAHLVKLQMTALKVAHPHEYRVRKVSDKLEIAVTSWKEAERYAQILEQQLTERTRTLQGLRTETDRLRASWDHVRTQYHRETTHLAQQLELARDRARQAEHRVQALEEFLDQLESQQPTQGELPTDINPHDPRAVTGLLDSFRRAGAEGQVAMLVERIPDLPLDLKDPYEVAGLLDALRRVGAEEQIAMLVERVPDLHLSNPYAVVKLLDVLRRVGAEEQIAMLVERVPDLHLDINDPHAVIGLLDALRRVGAEEQIAMLVEHVPDLQFNDLHIMVKLLDALWRVRAYTQIGALVERVSSLQLDLRDPYKLAGFLDALRRMGATEQVAGVVEHLPDLHLRNLHAMAKLLDVLQRLGAHAQITALAKRIATNVSLDSPQAIIVGLYALQRAGADDQVMALAERASVSVPLDSPKSISRLLSALQEVGADVQAKALAERAALTGGEAIRTP